VSIQAGFQTRFEFSKQRKLRQYLLFAGNIRKRSEILSGIGLRAEVFFLLTGTRRKDRQNCPIAFKRSCINFVSKRSLNSFSGGADRAEKHFHIKNFNKIGILKLL